VRFLDRASFGASTLDIFAVSRHGYGAWIDAQLDVTPTLLLPELVAFGCGPDQQGETTETCPGYMSGPHRALLANAWWSHALYAPDQLRQRVAFALSEIFVVSDRSGATDGFPSTLSDYYDTLVRGAFSNYRDLLEDVTLHPSMGAYLSMAKNRKEDLSLGTRPDENFAREVMQLFSIGLSELNPDGSLRLGANSMPIPTYDQDVITETARALTGWNYDDGTAPSSSLLEFLLAFPRVGMMVAWQAFHDTDEKSIVADQFLPAGQTADQDLDQVLDALSHHPNVGPFIGRQLIQRLVTSNPSPQYVERITSVWNDDGSGVRGNLEAVVRAILLDTEALQGHAIAPDQFGKLREPILKLTGIWRKFDAVGETMSTPVIADEFFGQRAMGSPSVFNFFSPDYASPSLGAQRLVAPELQIATHSRVTRTANALTLLIIQGNSDLADGSFTEPVIDLGPLKAQAANPTQLVALLDLRMCGGLMSPETKTILANYLDTLPYSVPGLPPGLLRAVEGLALVAASPDYALQQ
jgi:uncharacterized protein (DUF1800 family)